MMFTVKEQEYARLGDFRSFQVSIEMRSTMTREVHASYRTPDEQEEMWNQQVELWKSWWNECRASIDLEPMWPATGEQGRIWKEMGA